MAIDCWAIAMVSTLAENNDFIFAVLLDVAIQSAYHFRADTGSEPWDPEPGDEVRFWHFARTQHFMAFGAKQTSC